MDEFKLRALTEAEKESFIKKWKEMLKKDYVPWTKPEIFEFEENE